MKVKIKKGGARRSLTKAPATRRWNFQSGSSIKGIRGCSRYFRAAQKRIKIFLLGCDD